MQLGRERVLPGITRKWQIQNLDLDLLIPRPVFSPYLSTTLPIPLPFSGFIPDS